MKTIHIKIATITLLSAAVVGFSLTKKEERPKMTWGIDKLEAKRRLQPSTELGQQYYRLLKKQDWLAVERLITQHLEDEELCRDGLLPGAYSAFGLEDYAAAKARLKDYLYGNEHRKVVSYGAVIEHAWLYRLATLSGDEKLADRAFRDMIRDRVKIPGTNEVIQVRNFGRNRDAQAALYLAAFYWGQLDEDHVFYYLRQAQQLEPNAKVPSISTWRLPILESQGKTHPDGGFPRIPFVPNPVDPFAKKREKPLEVPKLEELAQS